MNVYFDGSYTLKDSEQRILKNAVFGWGFVISGYDEHVEVHGARVVKPGICSGAHEVIAFIEAVLYLSSHGIRVQDVNFITDDELTAYGSKATVANGYACTSMHEALQSCLQSLVRNKLYTEEVLEVVRPYLFDGRFHKIKGHAGCVLNQRCDYLAKVASRAELGGKSETQGFLEWARNGFNRWCNIENKVISTYPPFVTSA